MNSEEISLSGYNFASLSGYIWHPDREPEAIVLMEHGIGEHIGIYQDWAARFCAQGFIFAGFDLRGHGLSSGKRGHVPGKAAVFDINAIVKYLNEMFPLLPIYLYGHSFGGNAVLYYALQYPASPISGIVASSPTLEVAPPAHQTLTKMAGLLVHIMPMATFKIGMKSSDLTEREAEEEKKKAMTVPAVPAKPEEGEEEETGNPEDGAEEKTAEEDAQDKNSTDDPLLHQYISVKTYYDMTRQAKEILNATAADFHVPVLVMHGVDDPLALQLGSVQLATHLGKRAQLKLWKRARHELHRESNNDEVFACVLQWIVKQLPAARAAIAKRLAEARAAEERARAEAEAAAAAEAAAKAEAEAAEAAAKAEAEAAAKAEAEAAEAESEPASAQPASGTETVA
ncbi:MAG: lysophospholipase [Bacteroidales bacterium]|nr:lysophospholipase [Bacteroidales bacterium]